MDTKDFDKYWWQVAHEIFLLNERNYCIVLMLNPDFFWTWSHQEDKEHYEILRSDKTEVLSLA